MSDKVKAQTNMSSVQKSKLSKEIKIAETFTDLFTDVVNQLGESRDEGKFTDEPVLSNNPVDVAIQKFINHLSAKIIKNNVNFSGMFKFESVSVNKIL